MLLLGMEQGWGESGGDDTIKKCPMCNVLIERDAGCAQMMCKRCKHVFCWYCLTSLDVSIHILTGLWIQIDFSPDPDPAF
jgi:hypothetical protein